MPHRSGRGAMVPSSSFSDESLNRGRPMRIFQEIHLTRTYFDEVGDYAVPNVLSLGDLVFRHDLPDIN